MGGSVVVDSVAVEKIKTCNNLCNYTKLNTGSYDNCWLHLLGVGSSVGGGTVATEKTTCVHSQRLLFTHAL